MAHVSLTAFLAVYAVPAFGIVSVHWIALRSSDLWPTRFVADTPDRLSRYTRLRQPRRSKLEHTFSSFAVFRYSHSLWHCIFIKHLGRIFSSDHLRCQTSPAGPGFRTGSPACRWHQLTSRSPRSYELPLRGSSNLLGAEMGDRRKGKGKASRGNGSNTKDYTSDATAQSSSSHVDRGIKNPVEYLDYCQMNEKLEAAAFNRGSKSDKFVPLNRLEDIWRDRLGRFLVILGLGKDIFLVDDITKNLIKTLSILVTIGWKKWDAFGDIFLEERGGSVRGDRNDHNLPYPLAILEGQDGDPFLGEHWAGKFRAEQSTFIPIIIKEGGNEIYREGRPLPFIRSQTLKLKNGGYGSVTREIIACHHFRKFSSVGLIILITERGLRPRTAHLLQHLSSHH
jgi:hypothetical protein